MNLDNVFLNSKVIGQSVKTEENCRVITSLVARNETVHHKSVRLAIIL